MITFCLCLSSLYLTNSTLFGCLFYAEKHHALLTITQLSAWVKTPQLSIYLLVIMLIKASWLLLVKRLQLASSYSGFIVPMDINEPQSVILLLPFIPYLAEDNYR